MSCAVLTLVPRGGRRSTSSRPAHSSREVRVAAGELLDEEGGRGSRLGRRAREVVAQPGGERRQRQLLAGAHRARAGGGRDGARGRGEGGAHRRGASVENWRRA